MSTITRPRPVTHLVTEGDLITSEDDPRQTALVGRSNAGVHLVLTEGAAEALARLLLVQDAAVVPMPDGDTIPIRELPGYDNDLWVSAALQLLVSASAPASESVDDVAWATRWNGETPHTTHRRPRRGFALLGGGRRG